MKKTTLIAILSFASSTSCFPQSFNAEFHLGYGMGAGNHVLGVNTKNDSYENVVGSLGQGVNAGINLNYMFNPNVGLDFGLGMLIGKEFEVTQVDQSSSVNMSVKGSMFRVMPGIRLSTGDEKSTIPYARFGLAVGAGTKAIITESYSFDFGESGNLEYELSQRIAVGWYGAVGIGFKLNDKINFNTELLMINQSWAPGKLKNTINSEGPLEPTITLEDEVQASDRNKDLTTRLPFGSIGLNVGLQFRL